MEQFDEYKKDLVSVIVPAYNVAGYIEECVLSICNQSYKQLEIIIVDDGSTDGTGKICDGFSDERIIVKHQQNKGFSGARNTGLNIAKGEYVAFIDSDDYIRETMIAELVSALKSSQADMAACAVEYLRCDDDMATYSGKSGMTIELNYKESLDYLCDTYLINVWNKLYKHALVADIRYVPGVVCEDVGYMREVYEKLNSSVYLDKPLYVYRVKRPGSSGMTFDARKLPAIEEYEKFVEYLEKRGLSSCAKKVKYHQLALIKALYCETEDEDIDNRNKMYHLYCEKTKGNNIRKKYAKSVISFILFPRLCRVRYRKNMRM